MMWVLVGWTTWILVRALGAAAGGLRSAVGAAGPVMPEPDVAAPQAGADALGAAAAAAGTEAAAVAGPQPAAVVDAAATAVVGPGAVAVVGAEAAAIVEA
ncbi:hypothetical protein ACI2LF_18210 [Kribbella sp. NPDC020789]